MLFSADDLSCLCPDHEFTSIIGNNYISMYKINTCPYDAIFLLNARNIDELIANQLPLLDALNPACYKFIMAARSKANTLYLPGLLMSVGHDCHDLFIKEV